MQERFDPPRPRKQPQARLRSLPEHRDTISFRREPWVTQISMRSIREKRLLPVGEVLDPIGQVIVGRNLLPSDSIVRCPRDTQVRANGAERELLLMLSVRIHPPHG